MIRFRLPVNSKRCCTTDLSDLQWHTITAPEVVERLVTSSRDGLSETQAQRRIQEYGKNAPSPPKTNRILTIFGYFFKGFGGILLVGSILVFVSWKPLGEPQPQIANLVRKKIKTPTILPSSKMTNTILSTRHWQLFC